MGWFRRRPASPEPGSGGSGTTAEVSLVVAQSALRWRSPEQFGRGTYYVRAYRSRTGRLPVIIIADSGNDPAASSSNRFDEIAVMAARVITGDQTGPEALAGVATWIDCRPAHGPFGETYYEMSFPSAGRGGHPPTSRYLRHAEVEELVDGSVEPLTFEDCAPTRLRKRGVQVVTVS